MNIRIIISCLLLGFALAAKASPHDHHDDEHEESHSTRISDHMADNVGIGTATVAAGMIQQTITSYGSLTTGPEQLSHVRARYSGMILSVKRTIGDRVQQGDLLAEVESNQSLKTYPVYAPISGVIIQRHANQGEVTRDQVLFSIADFSELWAELRIYPAQQAAVATGLPVTLLTNGQTVSGRIEHIIPHLSKPYQQARVKFDNRQLLLSPGLLVEARIQTDSFTSPLTIEKAALQTMEDQQGIFIKEGEHFEFAPVVTGRSDGHRVEVLSGVKKGQIYVNRNSYLIKADMEKSAAEHVH